jgi:hypothetical protein
MVSPTKPKQQADRRSRDHGRHDTSIVIRGKRQWRTQLRSATDGQFCAGRYGHPAQARRDNQTISFPQLGARVQLVATEYRKI